jgi:hypothetical protein
VKGGAATVSQAAISFSGANVGAQNRGLTVSAGTLTFDGGSIEEPAVSGTTNAIGAEITGGVVVLAGPHISGAGHFTGLQISATSAVTLKGNAAGIATLTTSLPASSTDTSDGVVLLTGATAAQLLVDGNVQVSDFHNGVTVNDGSFVVQGAGVAIQSNRNDGVDLLGRSVPTASGPTLSLTGATLQNNGGKGLVVRTIVPVTVHGCAVAGNGGDGIDAQRTQTTAQVTVAQLLLTGNMVAGNAGRGIALTGQGAGTGVLLGGKVGARLTGNTVSANVGVGVYVTEAPDNSDGDDITEVWMETNDIGGNLTTAGAATILAGGVFFASSDSSTRILLHSFLGNRVHGNGKSEIGFNLIQNDGTPWNLSSDPTGTATACDVAAEPNAVYCYDTFPGDFAIAVSGTTVHLNVKGMQFQYATATPGRDFTATIPATEITAFCAPQVCQ